MRGANVKVEIGNRYGRLVVVERVRKDRRARWACICDCGTETEARGDKLRDGSIQSCGCLWVETYKKNLGIGPEPAKNSGFRGIVNKYRQNAKRVAVLVSGSCYYCGCSPSNSFAVWDGQNFEYSGIDRLHSDYGYEPSNVVSCCWVCNRMKGKLTEEEFIEHVKRVLSYSTEKRGRAA